MSSAMRHIALVVPDLQAAEKYYQELFGMDLIMREAELEDGLWYTLPFDKNWEDAKAGGIELGMIALKKDKFVLALFSGVTSLGQVHTIGLSMSPKEIAGVRSRLPHVRKIGEDKFEPFEFQDTYDIVWQIWNPSMEFLSNGDSGRLLKI